MRSLAGAAIGILALILFNVYSEHGSYGVRSWLRAKFFNDPLPKPAKKGPRKSGHSPGGLPGPGSPQGVKARQKLAAS